MVSESGLISVRNFKKTELLSFFKGISEIKSVKQPCIGLLAFFELSSRTRMSFEAAGLELGIRWMSFEPERSSLGKGESLRESIELFRIYPIDFCVLRHSRMGICSLVQKWINKPVLNAGEGCYEHPTQALGDAYSLWSRVGPRKLKIVFYGDVIKSRVARSSLQVFRVLGHEVGVVDDLSKGMRLFSKAFQLPLLSRKQAMQADIIYALRTQKERGGQQALEALHPKHVGLKTQIMHAGPVIWGEDLHLDWKNQSERLLIQSQVEACYLVRRKILNEIQKRCAK